MWFELPIEVIPAVDVLGEEAVRLEQGDYQRVVERADEPVALARRWVEAGAQRIHLVDLDGARSGRVRPELVSAVAKAVRPALLQASGGIRSLADARLLLDAGADRVIVGTAAWPEPEPWLELGAVIALDVRDGEVMGRGWTKGSGVSLEDALARLGDARVLLTAIERDGTLAGPDLELVRRVAAAGARVLAAGGVRSPEDVEALAAAGAEAAVVGRALLRP
ncbi:MAG TPA: HisA/HisF-related TIM barrel protein [Gaiellaceae bacterium]|nr:HisA/HisF-related TIM barrel protein [Gaiellaceae bacterium]